MAADGDVAGSDAVFDHVCDPCSDEHTVGAVGFCVDCEEWLCQDCFKTHRKPKPLRNHVLMTEEEMKNSTQTFNSVDKCSEKCEQHGGKRIKYFCKDHYFLGCSKCIFENHRSCNVQNIPDSSNDPATKSELQQMTIDLNEVVKQSKEIVVDVSDKLALVKQNKIETVEEFRNYKNEVIASLDNIEMDIENKCSEREEKETKRLQQIVDECETIEKEGLLIQNQLEVFEDRGQLCNMFVAMKKSRGKVETLMNDVKHSTCSTGVTLYSFKPSLKASEILNSLEATQALVETRHMASKVDYSSIQCHYVTDITVKAEGNKTCRITSSAMIDDQKLVLIDCNNKEVKVVDTQQNKLISQFKIDGSPLDVCKVTDSSVAVTVYDKSKILFLTIDAGKLSFLKTVAISEYCIGVAVEDDRLIVSYQNPDKIEILDMEGSILLTIGKTTKGQDILCSPTFISLSLDKKSFYVTNLGSSTVTCMRLDGTITATYKDDELRGPEQTTVDSNGMVYVVAYLSNNVHLISPDCKKMKVILRESDGLMKCNALSYCKRSSRLYIGMDSCDVIKVFQLK